MSNISEIDSIIEAVKKECPNVLIFQLTNLGEQSVKSGVWKFWLESNEDLYIKIEVQNGMCYALYSNKTFDDKYPITAPKICKFFTEFQDIETGK